MGLTPEEATARLNIIGSNGWRMVQNYLSTYRQRRSIFVHGAMAEYLVVDYPTGKTTTELEALLDGYGVDGWELTALDLILQNVRRAIFMRGGDSGTGGGGIEEAPLDDVTYGRRNAGWNPALALDNDVLDGGNF